MDIDLFSDMIKSLVLDNDEVTLPGLGMFLSETVPASFSDKGFTINPPYRRLSFRNRQGNDSLLVEMYSRANSTDLASASRIIGDFVSRLGETLRSRKCVVLPGLGKLRATKENSYFFVPDEDLDIYQYGFGLEPLSLKTHEETPEEVSSAVAALRALVDIPEAAPDTVPEPATTPTPEAAPDTVSEPATTPTPEAAPNTVPEPATTPTPEPSPEPTPSVPGKRNALRVAALVTTAAAALAIFVLGGMAILGRLAPDVADSLLYSQEERHVIRQFEQLPD